MFSLKRLNRCMFAGDEGSSQVGRHRQDHLLRGRLSSEGDLRDGRQLPPVARLAQGPGHHEEHHQLLHEGTRPRLTVKLLRCLRSGMCGPMILLPLFLSPKNNPDHLLHHNVTAADAACQQRLVSSSPFRRHAVRLPNENYAPAKAWSDCVDSGPPLIQTACHQPRPVLPPGADLPREQWVKLNRLRCGTAHVGDTLKLWGAQESACGHNTQSVRYTRLLMALLVFAAQMQQLGLGWKT